MQEAQRHGRTIFPKSIMTPVRRDNGFQHFHCTDCGNTTTAPGAESIYGPVSLPCKCGGTMNQVRNLGYPKGHQVAVDDTIS